MRAAAKVSERILGVGRDGFVFRQTFNQLDLVRLVLEQFQRLCPGNFLAHKLVVPRKNAAHFLLDKGKISLAGLVVCGKVEIIVKTIVDCRTDGNPSTREKIQHRFCHHMRTAVAHHLQTFVNCHKITFLYGARKHGLCTAPYAYAAKPGSQLPEPSRPLG